MMLPILAESGNRESTDANTCSRTSSDGRENTLEASMVDPTSVLVDNLREALSQINLYITLGFVTAVSALVLEFPERLSHPDRSNGVQIPGGFIPMAAGHAQLLLFGTSFVAGLMGAYAAKSASVIVYRLRDAPELLTAACTYSSVATASLGIPVIAAILPPILVALIFWHAWKRLKEPGLLYSFAVFGCVYVVFGSILAFLPCRSPAP
jgi:hypothetical protein